MNIGRIILHDISVSLNVGTSFWFFSLSQMQLSLYKIVIIKSQEKKLYISETFHNSILVHEQKAHARNYIHLYLIYYFKRWCENNCMFRDWKIWNLWLLVIIAFENSQNFFDNDKLVCATFLFQIFQSKIYFSQENLNYVHYFKFQFQFLNFLIIYLFSNQYLKPIS